MDPKVYFNDIYINADNKFKKTEAIKRFFFQNYEMEYDYNLRDYVIKDYKSKGITPEKIVKFASVIESMVLKNITVNSKNESIVWTPEFVEEFLRFNSDKFKEKEKLVKNFTSYLDNPLLKYEYLYFCGLIEKPKTNIFYNQRAVVSTAHSDVWLNAIYSEIKESSGNVLQAYREFYESVIKKYIYARLIYFNFLRKVEEDLQKGASQPQVTIDGPSIGR